MQQDDLEREASRPRSGFMKQALVFLGQNKKWWLAPILLTILLLGGLVLFSSSTAAAPFIYTLF